MTAIGDPIGGAQAAAAAAQAAAAAAARAAGTVRRPATDAATTGHDAPGGAPARPGAPLVPRGIAGASDPTGQSGRLVDVFA